MCLFSVIKNLFVFCKCVKHVCYALEEMYTKDTLIEASKCVCTFSALSRKLVILVLFCLTQCTGLAKAKMDKFFVCVSQAKVKK